MINKVIIILFCFWLGAVAYACSDEKSKPSGESEESNVKVPLADPYILYYDGIYYAYGTYSPDGIMVFTSNDLETWEVPDNPVNGLALHKSDVWGERWFWAPEVYHENGKFYMYFSADEHICVATSDHPLGPFTQDEKKPMITEEKSIDNSLFIDGEGKAWLYFVRFNDGNNIWVAELEDNLTDIKDGTMQPCIHVSQEWEEVWPRVNEGAFVVKHKDLYYMTYSANSYESQFYGVGFATSESPNGNWVKYDGNPIMQKPGDLVGVGHSAMFRDENGDLKIVFHAHNNETNIHPRHMYISDVRFEEQEEGPDLMVIDEEYIVPHLKLD